jgi:hypothetical protein
MGNVYRFIGLTKVLKFYNSLAEKKNIHIPYEPHCDYS